MDRYLRNAVLVGVLASAANVHVSLVGMVITFQTRDFIADVITLGSAMPLLIALIAGWVASRPERGAPAPSPVKTIGAGLLAGAVAGAILAVVVWLTTVINMQSVLVNASNRLVEALRFGQADPLGSLILIGGSAALGAFGAALHVLPPLLARAATVALGTTLVFSLMEPFVTAVLRNLSLEFVARFLFSGGGLTIIGFVLVFGITAAIVYAWGRRGGAVRERAEAMPADRRRNAKLILFGVVGLLLLALPQIVGPRLSEVLTIVGIYVLLGLGLNIVVGFAGLLDLGYVAFYAVGAYTTAILTSPVSPLFNPQLSFWAALPFVIVAAGVIGLMVGTPVLRLRGDYLAIVTLGFGEIARIIFLSEWAKPVAGGAQGILSVPPPLPFSRDPQVIYYPILIFCVIAALGAVSLAGSRVGRAWNAMREDESVAEATGVSTVKYKLLAFGLGAAFGCLSGALFAAKIGTIFPNSFDILVSINALSLIILGGMGNIFGVVLGAAVLVGLPELLREFSEYRLLIYGAVLVAMMILRPEGLLPSRSRRAELHEREDDDEEMYESEAGVDTGRPVVTT
jgi:branched-chain amino acid transport system permease protein